MPQESWFVAFHLLRSSDFFKIGEASVKLSEFAPNKLTTVDFPIGKMKGATEEHYVSDGAQL